MAASLGNATVNVLARTVLFEQSLKRSLKRMSILTAGIFAGVAAANFFGGAIKDAASLELRIARIKTLMEGTSEAQKAAFDAKNIRNFSNEIGISADKVAESIYYMIGSGVQLQDAYAAVRAASNVAVATNTDLKFSSDFVSTALNAMGGTVDKLTGQVLDSAHATDIFFAALAEGKGEPRELAQFISTAVPAAKGLAISYGEVNAAMAAGTLLGTKARKVTTGLSYIMRGLGNENKGVGEAFKEITGTGFAEWAKKSANQGNALQKAIKILGTEVGLGKISNIGGAETGLEAIKLLLTVWPQYVAIQKEVAGASGDANTAVEIVNKTLSRQVDILKNKFKNFRGSVGDWLGPVIYDAIAKVQAADGPFRAVWNNFVANVKAAWDSIAPIIMPALNRIRAALASVDWAGVAAGIGAFFTGVLAIIGPIVVAVTYAFAGIMTVISPLLNLMGQMKPVLVALGVLWISYRLLLIASSVATVMHAMVTGNLTRVMKANWVIQKLATAALFAKRVALLAVSAATAAYNIVVLIATGGLNRLTIAMTLAAVKARLLALATSFALGPIGLVIIAVAALAAGFVFAWKKSETFQKIVKKAFNAIVVAVAAAVKFIVSAFGKYVDTILFGFQKILEGLGHLPDWLGGGKADAAAAAIQRLRDNISRMVDDINGQIDRIQKNIQFDVSVNLKTLKDDAGRTSTDRLSLFNAGIDPDTVKGKASDILKDRLKNSGLGTPKTYGGGSDFSGGGYSPGGGGGDDAKAAASEAAKKIKAALKRVLADVARIAKHTSKQSVETIKENFKTLYADLAEGARKDLIPGFKKVEKQLVKLGSKRDGVEEKLDKAKEKLKALKDASKQFTDAIKEQVREMGNVSDASKGIGTTYNGIRGQLKSAVAQTKQFTLYIDKLRKLGLNDTSLRQIIDAGPVAGMQSAKALVAAGKKGVDTIDGLQAQLDAAGGKLATSANDQFYKAGVAAAEGLVRGLEKQEAAIVKQMDRIADKLVASIKKKLGIKSPSVVFGEIGENISAGLANGITAGGGGARQAISNVTNDIKVSVSGVSDPAAARRAGILSGQGIQNVLTRQRMDLVKPII